MRLANVKMPIRQVTIHAGFGLSLALAGIAVPLMAAQTAQAGESDTHKRYVEQVAAFQKRADGLGKELAEARVKAEYCKSESPSLAEDRLKIAGYRKDYESLRDDYKTFKDEIGKAVRRPGELDGFTVNPAAPGFWADQDVKFIETPKNALIAKETELASRKQVECGLPDPVVRDRSRNGQSGGARNRDDTASGQQADQAAGEQPKLEGPTIPIPADLTAPQLSGPLKPDLPTSFCTEEEKKIWYDDVYKPVRDAWADVYDKAAKYYLPISSAYTNVNSTVGNLERNPQPVPRDSAYFLKHLSELKQLRDRLKKAMDLYTPIYDRIFKTKLEVIALEARYERTFISKCQPPAALDLSKPFVPDSFCSEQDRADLLALLATVDGVARKQMQAWSDYVFQLRARLAALSGKAAAKPLAAKLVEESSEATPTLDRAVEHQKEIADLIAKAKSAKKVDCSTKTCGLTLPKGIAPIDGSVVAEDGGGPLPTRYYDFAYGPSDNRLRGRLGVKPWVHCLHADTPHPLIGFPLFGGASRVSDFFDLQMFEGQFGNDYYETFLQELRVTFDNGVVLRSGDHLFSGPIPPGAKSVVRLEMDLSVDAGNETKKTLVWTPG